MFISIQKNATMIGEQGIYNSSCMRNAQILTRVEATEPPNPLPPYLLGLCPSAIWSTFTLCNALLATALFLRARLQALELTPREQEEIATSGLPSRLPTTAALAIASFRTRNQTLIQHNLHGSSQWFKPQTMPIPLQHKQPQLRTLASTHRRSS